MVMGSWNNFGGNQTDSTETCWARCWEYGYGGGLYFIAAAGCCCWSSSILKKLKLLYHFRVATRVVIFVEHVFIYRFFNFWYLGFINTVLAVIVRWWKTETCNCLLHFFPLFFSVRFVSVSAMDFFTVSLCLNFFSWTGKALVLFINWSKLALNFWFSTPTEHTPKISALIPKNPNLMYMILILCRISHITLSIFFAIHSFTRLTDIIFKTYYKVVGIIYLTYYERTS